MKAAAYTMGKYLLGGKAPDEKVIVLYLRAIEIKQLNLNDKENRIWNFMLKNQWSIVYIDSALALFDPQSVIRKRLLVMLAILETMPEYSHLFLSRNRTFLYHFYILWVGLRAGFKALAGMIILKIIN
jgi:hypothetical protein